MHLLPRISRQGEKANMLDNSGQKANRINGGQHPHSKNCGAGISIGASTSPDLQAHHLGLSHDNTSDVDAKIKTMLSLELPESHNAYLPANGAFTPYWHFVTDTGMVQQRADTPPTQPVTGLARGAQAMAQREEASQE